MEEKTEDITQLYQEQNRCHWLWFRVSDDDSSTLKNLIEDLKLKENILYAEYQLKHDQTYDLHAQGMLKLCKQMRVPKIKDIFKAYVNHSWGTLPSETSRQAMKLYIRKKDTRVAGFDTFVYGDEPIKHISETRKRKKEEDHKVLAALIETHGLMQARFEWFRNDGCNKIWLAERKQYIAKQSVLKEEERVEKATKIMDQKNLKQWQKYLKTYCEAPVNDREILVILDEQGNSGKSFFMKNYKILNPETTCIMSNAHKRDLMHVLSKLPLLETIFFNIPRSGHERINYEAIEEVKDGELFSTKYNGTDISINATRMIICTNMVLEWKALSIDRWKIMIINSNRDDFVIQTYIEFIAGEKSKD